MPEDCNLPLQFYPKKRLDDNSQKIVFDKFKFILNIKNV
ncbi:hypothetical protein JCM19538_1735 [Jejuia pallidilutea]|nr:hypothetical protein JCM19538_1735 [Jejuia pallidilutea]